MKGIDDQARHLPPRPLAACPACGSARLETEVDLEGESVVFVCGECDRRWRVELGYVHEVHTS